MRRRSFLVILLLLIVVVTSVFFFWKRCNRVVPDINVDSLFVNLNDEISTKRAKQADKVFSSLNNAGLNGVVLYAEQGQVVYEADRGPQTSREAKQSPWNEVGQKIKTKR